MPYLTLPVRYSEDMDLVWIEPGPAGRLKDRLPKALDPWLGEARWKQAQGRITFGYRFLSEDVPAMRLRLKFEINTREHFFGAGFDAAAVLGRIAAVQWSGRYRDLSARRVAGDRADGALPAP